MVNRFLLILLAFSAVIPRAVAQSPIVGVLEDVPGDYEGEPNVREVRVVFQKSGHQWIAFPSNCPDEECLKTVTLKFPLKVNWNIGFEGKRLGQVSGLTPGEFTFYSHVGLQEITSKAPVPIVGERSVEFGGYTGEAVYRPLVANSEPYFNDPDGWGPSQLTSAEIHLFRRQFRQRFPMLCKNNEDETKLLPFVYSDQDVGIVKVFASRRGWKIARLHVQGAIACNDRAAGFEIDDPWFGLDPQSRFHYLGSGMWMVDAGDYGNDGSSELVFSIDRDNRGGYVLFYDDFTKRAVFEFGYH